MLPAMDVLGYLTLALTAFLAATVVPFSSEGAVLGALALGGTPGAVLVAASIGNCLGALSTVALGWWWADRAQARLARARRGARALAWAQRYGSWCLLLSWLPFVGDLVLLAAGILRLPAWAIVLFGLGTRVARYVALIAWAT
jgi:membrane protein YqaA with SNARE-associated domain